ncbi:MAG: tRNA (adenosine(37)-N6)-threonylcarbamoyltransferase complex ATPase subunit type 1 TsaE [candidate division Zixibacteria bacterium]|nr:tRNA (adenosine(37)-N6)-threonylcarbamoyltransferase complex ATPase subunit type 1 TsaE [candidate division Zixibacteria bacterium]
MAQKNIDIIITGSEEETIRTGRRFAAILQNGDLVVLTGPLGAGKTCFIKGIALGLGVKEEEIKSPSFTLVNEYYGSRPLFHFDLYRMKLVSELYQIGWDDYLLRDGIVVVEWGEKAEEFLPEKRVEVAIDIISENERRLSITLLRD